MRTPQFTLKDILDSFARKEVLSKRSDKLTPLRSVKLSYQFAI